MTAPFSFTTTAGTTSGTIESAVYRESGSGTLDFYYQIANSASSATSLKRETNTDFGPLTPLIETGFRPDGSMLTGTNFVNGTMPPDTADRDKTGRVVGFNFVFGDVLSPGQTSKVLIIATLATSYGAGNAEIIDGGAVTVGSFGPISSVPEPISLVLTLSWCSGTHGRP